MNQMDRPPPIPPRPPTPLWRFLPMAIGRAALVGLLAGIGFAAVGFLSQLVPLSSGELLGSAISLQTDSLSLNLVLLLLALQAAAGAFQVVAFGVCLATDLTLGMLVQHRPVWTVHRWLIPTLWGALGAAIFYPQADHGPKETLLASAGALVGVLASGVFLWLFEVSQPEAPRSATNTYWYALIAVLTVTLAGAFRGWTSESPQVARLLRYRDTRAEDPRAVQRLPIDPDLDSPLLQ